MLREIHNFMHLNLAIALLLSLIVFVSGIENATNSEVSPVNITIARCIISYILTIGWLYNSSCFVTLFPYRCVLLDAV